MSFEYIMRKILPDIDGTDGFTYRSYINDSVSPNPPTPLNLMRSDYNDTTPGRKGNIHGGVDIYYYKQISDETAVRIGSGEYPNNDNPLVYAFVEGEVIDAQKDSSNNKAINDGGVSILDHYGYVHTIFHLSEIYVNKGQEITGENILDQLKLGKMGGMLDGRDRLGDHVHYEISTYFSPTPVANISQIDPEAFWNNYPTDPINGFFLLSGSYKANNQFYGTSSKEILRGEGDHASYDIVDGGKILNDNSDNDTLSGGGGSDIIDGGSGNDKLFGGNEYVIGKYYKIDSGKLITDQDIVNEDADDSSDTLIGGMGSDYLSGGRGNDVLYGGVATISGSQVNDYPDYDNHEDAAKDKSNDTLVGGEGNDFLYGGAGNDILAGDAGTDKIYGGNGSDKLIGGTGNDKLYGGTGFDTYIFRSGDGQDTVNEDAKSRLVYIDAEGSSHNLGTFYNSGNGSYTTADGLITYSGGVFSLPGGDSVQLSLGDSGVNLILIPESGNSETGNTITGDFEPFDFDPNQEGIQSKNDEWGNVIPDTTKPDPGREDTLYDTTASDKIEGQGGDDCITSSRGGNDWLSGGDGDDTIDATAATGNCTLKGGDGDDYIDATGTTGNCILEGGTGADFLLAGTGSDKIFAESYGEMASLIAAGETAPGSGSTGDMGYGGDGNDFVYGSNNNDMLYGGLGKDLLVGGGGSDIVDGGTGNDARLLKYPEGHANAHMLCCAAPLPGFRRGRLAATYAKSTSHYSGFARPKYSGLRLAPERF